MERVVAEGPRILLTLRRLAWQMVEQYESFLMVGLEPRGVPVAQFLYTEIQKIVGESVSFGTMDVTFWRDDLHMRGRLHIPRPSHLSFSIEGRGVWLVDDVIYTGRTVRAAMDALREFGRPAWLRLAVLVDRRGLREVPILPDCAGFVLDTAPGERVWVQMTPNPFIRIGLSV
ncbi:MAG: bifunctional pyr operon transcriptional regulator/uracil phosphoribosyltransferase PyrR [Bacteroidia bacterium]|nr:bifunctional pyr operon transcriptional regulator/uracil phosphoribosyltransferase PyrR [Bacteroidia bacterium]